MATQITTAIAFNTRYLSVDVGSGTSMPFLFDLGGETLRCVGGGGGTAWECDRGVNNTFPSSHVATTALTEVALVTFAGGSGVPSSAAPTDLPANGNGFGMWANAKAAGDHRAIYARLFFAFASASGEAIRAFATVKDAITAAVGGTVNGLHATLSIQGTGQVSGSGNALRATLGMDASANPGGTLAVIRADTDLGTSAVIPARTAFLATDNLGTPKLDYLLSATNPSTTMFATAGTGANSAAVSTGGVAAKVIKVSIGGVDYWLPLFSSNS